jgi:hypothetical protein
MYFPRPQGMGWKLTKFHQLLHFPHNIRRHGSALNFDGGCPEYYGNYFCKDLTARTQRGQISLGKQTAQRYFEMSCVLEAKRILVQSKTSTYLDNNKYKYFLLEEATRHDIMEHTLKARLCFLSLDPNNPQ